MTKTIQIWLSAFRLRTLPLATASIALGSFLAASEGAFEWHIAMLCFVTAVLLQVLANLANDYGDAVHGADSENRIGPKRATQSGLISTKTMRLALVILVLLCLGVGFILVRGQSPIFYLAGLAAIAAALAYTAGPRPYGYAGLGDLFVFLFFGIVGVFGSCYLQTQHLDLQIILPAASCGFFCVAVLNVNNIRDLTSDKLSGKHTLPVRLGEKNARIYHAILLALGFGTAFVFTLLNWQTIYQFLYFMTLPLVLVNGRAVLKTESAALDPYLKQLALTTMLFSLTFGLGTLI
ncbi:1,4-dihydroxy-2-naphthoate polyprenyltransferase [candidate division KSB1 bacterium]|nr:1,4-dihydroxy-2-naphthoate polyprenyltransferase [candidate division KSB1 bacterium]NIR69450.1 1,4-dihydroxy-2-naphthoate polyprenyltransferase [candidate division KSB1 bacterium]NIS22799.1 1,4-dihydroxy-2-naphthoate polyprenyltransferase [candidate division KSB1 bacterium]NIT69639.1 1,4-dihydroxy-2-naphthoate polyprenyltransferase [candidate division KSB1 bacterium]NIU23308.1 1,4-dihydroxy-2-naphthoate polyprenyltransferase [candidate division KSB1 bacterium]